MFKKFIYLLMFYSLTPIGMGWAQTSAPVTNQTNAEPVVPLNRIVAVVNDEIITQNELDAAVDQLAQQLTLNKVTLPPRAKLQQEALHELINYRLQLQIVNRNEIKATDSEIDKTIEQIAKSHNLTVDQLKQQLVLQNSNYEQFRKKLGEQIAINRLQQQMVASHIKITDEDISQYRNTSGTQEYKLVDFFFPLSEQPSEDEIKQSQADAQTVKQKLESGTDPGSITPAYRDLGWRTPNDLPQIFAEQLPKLTIKNASEPLRAPNGYHVLKLIEVRNPLQTMPDDQIRQILFQKKYETAVKAAVEKSRSEAYIQIIPQ